MNSKPSVKVSVEPSVRGYVLSTFRKVESSDKTIAFIDEFVYILNRKSTVNRPIPTLASNSKLHFCNGLQKPEEASASESASEINTGIRLNNYSGITRQSLAMTGFAACLV
jgi:hypothetical protein